jgi:arabinose-5-phosphate isomerase
LHPAEGSHGDLGVIDKKDIVIALSYGGESVELVHVLEYMGRKGIPMIAITGAAQSSLAKAATCVLNVFVSEEACPLGLAPTASSTATLAMGDALAMALLDQRGFRPQDFAEIHPGGSLGFKLLTKVRDVMHSGSSLPLVKLGSPMKEVFSVMTHKDVRGAAGVVDDQGSLVGIVTDGDIRRRLEKSADPLQGTAEQMMSRQPRVIEADELAEKALFLMEQFRINLLFVLDRSAANPLAPVGILHIQDLLKAKVR